MSAKPPAFQFYFRDWLSSSTIAEMGAANTGIYSVLLARQAERGSLPVDPVAVAALLPASFLCDWPGFIAPREGRALGWLSSAFPQLNAEARANRRLGEVLGEREAYIEAGKKGGQATQEAWLKWRAGLGPKPGRNGGTASASASAVESKSLAPPGEAKARHPPRRHPLGYPDADELDRRAGIPVPGDPPAEDDDTPPEPPDQTRSDTADNLPDEPW